MKIVETKSFEAVYTTQLLNKYNVKKTEMKPIY